MVYIILNSEVFYWLEIGLLEHNSYKKKLKKTQSLSSQLESAEQIR